MGVTYVFEGIYHMSKNDKESIEVLYNKPILTISNKEFRKWYKLNKKKDRK